MTDGGAPDWANGGERDGDDFEDRAYVRGQIAEQQAKDAVGLVVTMADFDADVDIDVVAVLRFQSCTGAGGDGISEPFAHAADFLVAHPEVIVVATNWHTTPCDSGGEHLALELIVRAGNPTWATPTTDPKLN